MTEYIFTRLSDCTALAAAGPLPARLVGSLALSDLQDASWCAGFEGTGFWPVDDISEPLLTYQVSGDPVLTADAEARRWTRTRPAVDMMPAAAAAELRGKLAKRRFDEETRGISLSVGGKTLPLRTDRDSQYLVKGMRASFNDGVITTADFTVAAGVDITVDAAAVTAIDTAVVLHVQACRSAETTHSRAIGAIVAHEEMTDTEKVTALRAYAITTGWP